jgi:hypothetical protein
MSTTIIRAPRRHRFVIIDQRVIEDTSLSWAARGQFTPEDAIRLHAASREWLSAMLAEPFDGKTVVVTHHAPRHSRFIPGMPATWRISWMAIGLLSGSMATCMSPMTMRFMAPG